MLNRKNKGYLGNTNLKRAGEKHAWTNMEIEEYKKTAEYNMWEERQEKNKPHRYKKQTPDETQKIIAQFAKVIGISPADAIQIKPQEEVLR